MQFLKQSTAATVHLGILLDGADLAVPDSGTSAAVNISKNGGGFNAANPSTSPASDANGCFSVSLSADDTDTLGRLDVIVSTLGANMTIARFMVVPANVYNSLFLGSDLLDVNVKEISDDSTAADTLETCIEGQFPADVVKISGDSTAADNAELMFDGTGYAGGTTKLQVVDTALDAANTELSAVPNTAGTLRQMIQFLFTYFRNKKTVTADTETLYKEDGSTALGSETLGDNGTMYTKGEMG